jgi:MazG family protein
MNTPLDATHHPLEKILNRLRELRKDTSGCPWLAEKSALQLFPYFLEELWEYQQSLAAEGPKADNTREELGDLVFQLCLHLVILEEENGNPALPQLLQKVEEKIVLRHPHVFNDKLKGQYKTSDEAGKAWETLKLEEAKKVGKTGEVAEMKWQKLERIPQALPALHRAWRIGEKTQGFKFDWDTAEQVLDKVKEEFQELLEAKTEEHESEEFGDVLFSLAQYARHKNWDPELLLKKANDKFIKRFKTREEQLVSEGKTWDQMQLADKEKAWQKAKEACRSIDAPLKNR